MKIEDSQYNKHAIIKQVKNFTEKVEGMEGVLLKEEKASLIASPQTNYSTLLLE